MTIPMPPTSRRYVRIALVGLMILTLFLTAASSADPAALLSRFSTHFLTIFLEAVPFLLLGVLVSGLLDAFVHPDQLTRLLPRSPILAAIIGIFMGFIFPVGEYGVVPVMRRLTIKGLPVSTGVAFLLAAPIINPLTLASTYAAFGFGAVLIGRFIIAFIAAMIISLIFARTAHPQAVLRPALFTRLSTPEIMQQMPFRASLRKALITVAHDLLDLGRYLFIGALLASVLLTFIAQETLLAQASGPILSVLIMQALAFLLAIGSTGDAAVALAFTHAVPPGAIIAFLTFGAMLDLKSALLFASIFKLRTIVYIIILLFLLTLLIGVWINLNVPL